MVNATLNEINFKAYIQTMNNNGGVFSYNGYLDNNFSVEPDQFILGTLKVHVDNFKTDTIPKYVREHWGKLRENDNRYLVTWFEGYYVCLNIAQR